MRFETKDRKLNIKNAHNIFYAPRKYNYYGCHRYSGPACVRFDSYVWFRINGKIHNALGPASIHGNHKYYWLNGEFYAYKEWLAHPDCLVDLDGELK